MEHLVSTAVGTATQEDITFEKPRILVVGCGGAGGNSVSRLNRLGVVGISTLSVNTDKHALDRVVADKKLLLGTGVTKGLGCGGDPRVAERIAELAERELRPTVCWADMTFVTAGFGGGTGTGMAPYIAQLARSSGSVVVGIVTTPFRAEKHRLKVASDALERMKRVCDSVIVLDNNRLLDMVPDLPVEQAFTVMDYLVAEVVKTVSDLINVPSLINVDFADVRSVLKDAGMATVLYGENSVHDPERVVVEALRNAFLDIDYTGAKGALIHLTSGPSLKIGTAYKIFEGLTRELRENANVKFGARVDEELEGSVRVMAIMTGIQPPTLLPFDNRLVEVIGDQQWFADLPLVK